MNKGQLDKELIRLADLASGETRPEDACWIDHSKCPYGRPGGQFRYRPSGFCRIGNCRKLTDARPFLDEVFDMEKEIGDWATQVFEDEKVTLSSELRNIAETEIEDQQEKAVILLAADILEAESKDGCATNPKILSEDTFLDK